MPRCPPDLECPADPCAIVIFGATGDLTRRKLLPSLYHLWTNGLLPRDFALVGVVRSPTDDDGLRDLLSVAVREFSARPVDAAAWAEFRARIHCVACDDPVSIRGVSPGQGGGTLNATSMCMAMLEHWLGIDDLARNRLSWYVATTHVGYQPQGEAVDWTTERPRVSTSSEPVTATWYLLALFNQLGMFDRGCPETERRLP